MPEIIYFLPDIDAGVASIVRNLVKYRPASNIKYKVILTRQLERNEVRVKDKFNVDEQIVFKYSKYENLFAVFNRLQKYISSDNSFLVANDGLEIRMVRGLKLKNPLIYILHGDFKFYYLLSKQNEGIIDRYITYSIFSNKKLQQKLNIENRQKIFLQYYPVPDNCIKSSHQKQTDLIFAGSLTERKGVQFLKGIFEKIREQLPNVNMVIVGSGNLEKKLRMEFKNYSQVIFKGQLTNRQVLDEMRKSKLLLFPSLSEGLPNIVVEAMKAFCIPVCSDIESGVPDLIDHGKTGFIAPIGDENEFAQLAVSLLKDSNLANQMAAAGSKKALRLFKPNENAAKYESLILNSVSGEKKYPVYPLGGVLNQPFFPNRMVIAIRKLKLSSKL